MPKSREFCTISDDGEVSDLGLHAGILDDDELNDLLAERDAAKAASKAPPGLDPEDEADISDLDELDAMLAEGDAEDEWKETDHPRGQPGNAGQFGSGGGGGKSKVESKAAPAAKGGEEPRAPARAGAYAGQYVTTGSSPKENHALTVVRVLGNPVNRGIHYRRMLAQLIREAPGFGGDSAIPRLKAKLAEALVQSADALDRAGKTAEAEQARAQAAKLKPPETQSEQSRLQAERFAREEREAEERETGQRSESEQSEMQLEKPKAQSSRAQKVRALQAQLAPEKPPEQKTKITALPSVSPEFTATIKEHYEKLPEKVRKTLDSYGTEILIGKTMTEAKPDLVGQTPRGHPPGTTWDNIEGCYSPWRKQVIASQFYKSMITGDLLPTHRAQGVVNHETGHAFDYAMAGHQGVNAYSTTPAFMADYKADFDAIQRHDRHIKKRLAYYLQEGKGGPSEAFAEVFAQVVAGSTKGAQGADIKKYFPRVTEHIARMVA